MFQGEELSGEGASLSCPSWADPFGHLPLVLTSAVFLCLPFLLSFVFHVLTDKLILQNRVVLL